MNPQKREQLEAAGWRVGTAAEFLELSPEESAFVELKLSLSRGLQERRTRKRWTQAELARRIGSSQSRIAKAEASDPSVSVDFLLRALLATGATCANLADLIDIRGVADDSAGGARRRNESGKTDIGSSKIGRPEG